MNIAERTMKERKVEDIALPKKVKKVLYQTVAPKDSYVAINQIAFKICMKKRIVKNALYMLNRIGLVDAIKVNTKEDPQGVIKWRVSDKGREYIRYKFQEFLDKIDK